MTCFAEIPCIPCRGPPSSRRHAPRASAPRAFRSIVPYFIMEKAGRALRWPSRSADPTTLSLAARLPFFLLFLGGIAGLIVLLVLAFRSTQRWRFATAAGLVTYALTTPLAVGASIQPQVDGSVGVLLLGIA